ncbi:MAG: DUF2721 domain-containing protein [Nevskia sp.]|nr:DUF2721 domain-containing protein [Nevskia sp.]
MPESEQVSTIAHVIQLAVAPVFLLSGIAALLNVLTNRLNRIVDRARGLEAELPTAAPGRAETLGASLVRLSRRARLISLGIGLCTASAILISCVVIVLFVDSVFGLRTAAVVATLFIVAMTALTVGLVCFLREVHLATLHLRIGAPEPENTPPSAVLAPVRKD